MRNVKNLSVIIPFKNEGDEVEKTILSVLKHSNGEVKIVLINDCSDDEFDYKKIAHKYGCRYIESRIPIGVSQARDMGVREAETEYFVLMDGHMRIYDMDFDKKLLNCLRKHPNSIICSGTRNIAEEEKIRRHDGRFGAHVIFEPGLEYTLKWTCRKESDDALYEDVRRVPCVLGAFYASSKSHWERIGGLKGLHGYGFDETWMSIKTWLVGGECLSLKGFVTGHLYRKSFPATFDSRKYYANQIMMNEFFTTDKSMRDKYAENLRTKIGQEAYDIANKMIDRAWLEKWKKEFYDNRVRISIEEFLELNNKNIAKEVVTMKSQEELKALKKKIEEINKELSELSEEELSQVVGGEEPSYPLPTPTGPPPHHGFD